MERDRNIIRGAKLSLAGAVLLSGISLPVKETAPPNNDSSPPRTILLNEHDMSLVVSPTPSPTSTPTPESSPTPTPEPTIDYSSLNKVVSEMLSRPDLFNGRQVGDVEMYYPIYEAVAEKYDLNWEILWIIHEKESTASQSNSAFNGGSFPYYGAMQRDVLVWKDPYVNKAAEGLDYLADYPQRHKDDWREIAFAGKFLYDHMQKNIHKGVKENEAFLLALGDYNNPTSGYYRYEEDMFLMKDVFK